MVTKKRKNSNTAFATVKALVPKDNDTSYFGEEPEFVLQPNMENRQEIIVKTFNWYNHFYAKKDAKDFIHNYLINNDREKEAKIIYKVSDVNITNAYGWLARMMLRGFILTDTEKKNFNLEIKRLIDTVELPKVKEKSLTGSNIEDEKAPSNRPNVQEIMKEKAREAAGELEGMFDEFIINSAKPIDTKPANIVTKYNVLPQHVAIISDVWKRKLLEYSTLLEGKDSQLIQGYSQFNKTQLKNIVKFIEQTLSDLNSYISVKKLAKTPRKKKPVPVEKLVGKFKYQKTFKDTNKFELISLSPTKIHGASECYLYDTSKRKLIYLCADEYTKTFAIKGNSILGIDSAKSQIKTLRKPELQLKEFIKLGKPAGRKFFNDIKAVSTTPNGRGNDNLILLKAW